MTRYFVLAAAAGLALCAQHTATAQALQQQILEQQGLAPPPGAGAWSVTLGGGVAATPAYAGADTDRARIVPFAEIIYDKTLYLGADGLRVNLINSHGFHAGPLLSYLGGRNDDSDPRLYGLGDIHASLTAGAFVSYNYRHFQIATSVRQAITNTDNGLLGEVQADYLLPLMKRRMVIAFGPDMEFANARYNQTWFGVSQAQSFDSGLPMYTPGGGVRDYGVHATLTYHYSEHMILRAFGSIKNLTGDDANSPLVEDRTQSLFGVGLAYHF
jgi:outer membrane protein